LRVEKRLGTQKGSANSLVDFFFFLALVWEDWLLSVDPGRSPLFFRGKPAGYLQIAHSVREGKKVRQQVIATLGRLDLLRASGHLPVL
jgi:hypothetical protein